VLNRDEERYATLLRLVGSLSRLFSENESPYVDSRFVERLFVQTTGARDLGRMDISFDAIKGDVGVGVKTFLAGSGNSKREKVAEFTAFARDGRFVGLDNESLIREVVAARNDRVQSDANEVGIDVSKSFYHCLIRVPGGALVHEEPYGLIEIDALKPTDAKGNYVNSWSEMGNGFYFSDGIGHYSFSTAKNVLMKRFVFDRTTSFIPIEIKSEPLLDLEQAFSLVYVPVGVYSNAGNPSDSNPELPQESFSPIRHQLDEPIPGKDFVILPLYSTRGTERSVPERSGINQWNAGGRSRQLGEAYIPIPIAIHQMFPNFFPGRDEAFELQLPNQEETVSAKVCQDNSKALMTSPNRHLGTWIIGVLMPKLKKTQFEAAPVGMPPLTYQDLLRIQKDSVRVTKNAQGQGPRFEIEFAPVGSYEIFLEISNS